MFAWKAKRKAYMTQSDGPSGHRMILGAASVLLKGVEMSNEAHWVTDCITEGRKNHVDVTEAVVDRINKLLNRELSEKQLTQTALTKIATALIADMARPQSKAEAQE
jgi:hypothetical protein